MNLRNLIVEKLPVDDFPCYLKAIQKLLNLIVNVGNKFSCFRSGLNTETGQIFAPGQKLCQNYC